MTAPDYARLGATVRSLSLELGGLWVQLRRRRVEGGL